MPEVPETREVGCFENPGVSHMKMQRRSETKQRWKVPTPAAASAAGGRSTVVSSTVDGCCCWPVQTVVAVGCKEELSARGREVCSAEAGETCGGQIAAAARCCRGEVAIVPGGGRRNSSTAAAVAETAVVVANRE